ncbi:MAG: PilZ domain-containing protein [Myxococcaceae bacterium]|nr:PilZ domain-containing protein [Myxococcaceae bacterium]
MSERRQTDRRRSANTPEEKISRIRERRQGDRRDSPRYPMTFLVRDSGEDNLWEEREGDLSLGGIHWRGKTPPKGKAVDVRFRLPGVPREIRAQGEIIRLQDLDGGIHFHVRFTELDVKDELAIARYLDDRIAEDAART